MKSDTTAMTSRQSKTKLNHLIMGSTLLACAGVTCYLIAREIPNTSPPISNTSTVTQIKEREKAIPLKCEARTKERSPAKLVLVEPSWPSRKMSTVDDTTAQVDLPKAVNTVSLEAAKPPKARRLDIWSGFGLNYLKFSQKDSSGSENAQFSSITSPTLMVETRFVWNDNWSYVFSYNQMPGKIRTSENVTLNNDTYTWSYFSLEAERHIFDGPMGSRFYALGGLQRHQMPFLVGGTTTDVDLIQTQLTTTSLGARLEWQPKDKWLLESFMRYQIPITSQANNGDEFKTTGGVSFDGLLGVSRVLSENWKLGVFWFGQSHIINYTYTSADKSTQRNGTQTLFNSDLQVRFGYQWNFGKE